MKTDRIGNEIGTGNYHVDFTVENFGESVLASVSKSVSSESVYVTYTNLDNDKTITVRFSNHENNAVRFGDQLNGATTTNNEILFHLGVKKRTFVPNTYKSICNQKVAKKRLAQYEESSLTISEMYDLEVGTDISAHTGKLAKGSNYLILGSVVELKEQQKMNCFGTVETIGKFIYE